MPPRRVGPWNRGPRRTDHQRFDAREERSTRMARDINIAAQERFAEGVNTGNFDVFDEVVAPDVIDHDPAPEQGPGPQGFKDMFRAMRSAFPDLEVTPEHMTVTEDDVALAYTVTGTHEGEFLGVAPTGRKITARGVPIGRASCRERV